MKDKLNILIADDSVLFSQGLAILLKQESEIINSVKIAHNYHHTLEVLASHSIDILFLDLNFETEEFNGFVIAKKVKEIRPNIRVIVLTQQAKIDNYHKLIIEIKVDGYLDKQLGVENTIAALQAVCRGEKYIDKNIQDMLEIGKWMDISKREKEVIELLSLGYSQKKIAEQLFISPRTVETHVKNLTQKIHASNTVQLVATYMKYKSANREQNYFSNLK